MSYTTAVLNRSQTQIRTSVLVALTVAVATVTLLPREAVAQPTLPLNLATLGTLAGVLESYETAAAVDPDELASLSVQLRGWREQLTDSTTESDVHRVPFFSQFSDISEPSWRKVGCGIASVAMLIDYYQPGSADVDSLLYQGISAGAYLETAGWTHAGLIDLTRPFGLRGESRSLADLSADVALDRLREVVADGPVMASVHYTFDPQNPIPHLVVVTGVTDGEVHYNDPAEPTGGGVITTEQFQRGWKQRYITIRPVSSLSQQTETSDSRSDVS